jgi:GNAT superfamily N-acetyltransferase
VVHAARAIDCVLVRPAIRGDLERIVEILCDDDLHASPESPGSPVDPAYVEAFEAIERDPNNGVYVAERDGLVVGTFHLTFIRQVSNRGRLIAQVESVSVAKSARSRGVGTAMMQWALDEARRRGCLRVQLTTNVARVDAHRFYERLGFTTTHRGMKLYLNS